MYSTNLLVKVLYVDCQTRENFKIIDLGTDYRNKLKELELIQDTKNVLDRTEGIKQGLFFVDVELYSNASESKEEIEKLEELVNK